ncbi:uncharacterized protein LOC133187252 [Saccostrea echinata]|uniref:uncharacterized protein LOC133187252 n=1 Tax=Saccostrea echinata TaxID=191078 RepID=UPI002A80647E|nr:uncharacterized protein LOC133187252 [Saccostrea echinata]
MKVVIVLIACLFQGSVNSSKEEDVRLSCNFGSYDSDSNAKIDRDEFLEATIGYNKHDPKKVFARLDMNKNGEVDYSEFVKMSPALQKDGVFGHCRRRWCNGCTFWKK